MSASVGKVIGIEPGRGITLLLITSGLLLSMMGFKIRNNPHVLGLDQPV